MYFVKDIFMLYCHYYYCVVVEATKIYRFP
jgi:hypothetical protein